MRLHILQKSLSQCLGTYPISVATIHLVAQYGVGCTLRKSPDYEGDRVHIHWEFCKT